MFVFGLMLLGAKCQSVSSSESNAAGNTPDISQANTQESFVKKNEFIDSDFERNWKLWVENNISNYDLTVSIAVSSFTTPAEPVLIEVRAGKSISIKPLAKDDQRSLETYNHYDTVEKLFNKIKEHAEKGDKVKVKYNKELGYPEDTTFFIKNSLGFINIKIKKFQVVKLT